MLAGADQDEPFQVSALPPTSTAAQNEGLGHETEVKLPLGSMLNGANHEEPFQVSAPPWLSTATQSRALRQETERRLLPGSILAGADQEEPFQVSEAPWVSWRLPALEMEEGPWHPSTPHRGGTRLR